MKESVQRSCIGRMDGAGRDPPADAFAYRPFPPVRDSDRMREMSLVVERCLPWVVTIVYPQLKIKDADGVFLGDVYKAGLGIRGRESCDEDHCASDRSPPFQRSRSIPG